MRKILGIARYTFIEILRNRVYFVLLLFSGLLIGSALLLGAMGGEQRSRMIVDVGLASLEAISLIVAVFAATTLLVTEMESRTLYLILTRPVARYQFLLGRFLGLVLVMTAAMGIMMALHTVLMAVLHIPLTGHYLLSVLYSWGKIVLVIALAILFSLFSTSTPSAVTFTLFFWVMGHLTSEIHFLAMKNAKPAVLFITNIFYWVSPNFERLNIRDLPLHAALSHPRMLAGSFGYAALYASVCLALASFLFRKKEF